MIPKPVGSTHLRFSDARVVMGNSMQLPNVVRSPVLGNGHDEESQNGRDIKIDILEGYVRTPSGQVKADTSPMYL